MSKSTPKEPTFHKQRGSRVRERGVALVEGAAVLPVLALFFVATLYGKAVFEKRAEIQERTRSDAFTSAAHDCVDGVAEATHPVSTLPKDVPAPAAGLADAMPGSDGLGAAMARSSFFTLGTTRADGLVRVGRYARTLHNESHVLCNDPPRDGHWSLWFPEGLRYFAREYPL